MNIQQLRDLLDSFPPEREIFITGEVMTDSSYDRDILDVVETGTCVVITSKESE